MFYRFAKNDVRLAIDLDGIFSNQSVFILGGAPSGADFGRMVRVQSVSSRYTPPILAINNAGTVVQPLLWVGGDRPECYSESILTNPCTMKFGIISRRRNMVHGRPWADWPNTYFFGTTELFNEHNFLNPHRDLCWWKNTFFIALQLAYRLGFRKVYLVGCGFKISKEAQYAWETKLEQKEVDWNTRLYNNSVNQLKSLLPHFHKRGFEVISCTKESLANGILPYLDQNEAWETEANRIPVHSTVSLPHSSRGNHERHEGGSGEQAGSGGDPQGGTGSASDNT